MDEGSSYLSWAGDFYKKLEAVCVETQDMMHQVQMPSGQKTSKYLQEKVQGVQQFFTELMEDVLPSSPEGEGGDHEPRSGADLTDRDNSNIAVEADQCSKELTNLSLDEAMEVTHSALTSEPTSNKMCGKLESPIKGIEDDNKTEEIQCKTGCMPSMETRENSCKASSMIPADASTSDTKDMKSLNKVNPEESCTVGNNALPRPLPSYTGALAHYKSASSSKGRPRKHPICPKGYKQPDVYSLLQPFPSYTDAFTLYKSASSSKIMKRQKLPCASHQKDDEYEAAGTNQPKENGLHQSFLCVESQEQEFSDSDWEIV